MIRYIGWESRVSGRVAMGMSFELVGFVDADGSMYRCCT